MNSIAEISTALLRVLLADFRAKGHSASELNSGYVGVSFPEVREEYAEDDLVDFDLAVDGLEKAKLVQTGPMTMYENKPGSSVVIFATYSLKEYISLTEKGYREAGSVAPKKASAAPRHHVSISQSTIIGSPIGVGENITQTVDASNDAAVIQRLIELAEAGGHQPGKQLVDDVTDMVASARAGDSAGAQPIFKKLFGVAANGISQIAWGVVSTILAGAFGLA